MGQIRATFHFVSTLHAKIQFTTKAPSWDKLEKYFTEWKATNDKTNIGQANWEVDAKAEEIFKYLFLYFCLHADGQYLCLTKVYEGRLIVGFPKVIMSHPLLRGDMFIFPHGHNTKTDNLNGYLYRERRQMGRWMAGRFHFYDYFYGIR